MIRVITLSLILFSNLFGASLVGIYIKEITESMAKVNTMLAGVQNAYIGAYATPIITLYILFMGYTILYGKKKFETNEIVRLGIFVPIFLAISLNVSLFDSWITDPIAGISKELSNQIFSKGGLPGGKNTYDTIGKGVTTLITMGFEIMGKGGIINGIMLFLTGIALVIIGFVLVYNILIIFTLALINIAIYSWFLIFTLWLLPIKELSHIPKENFKQIVTYSLHVPIMSIIIVIFYSLVMDLATQTIASNDTEPMKIVSLLISSLIFLKALDIIGEVASALTGGRSSGTGGGASIGGAVAGAAAGMAGAKTMAMGGKTPGGAAIPSAMGKLGNAARAVKNIGSTVKNIPKSMSAQFKSGK